MRGRTIKAGQPLPDYNLDPPDDDDGPRGTCPICRGDTYFCAIDADGDGEYLISYECGGKCTECGERFCSVENGSDKEEICARCSKDIAERRSHER